MAEELKKTLERTRTLSPRLDKIVTIAALAFGIYEILFVFNFNYILYDLFRKLGINIELLRFTFQTKQGMAFVLAMVLIIAYFLYPLKKKEKYLRKVQLSDYLLITLSVISTLYIFAVYNRYAIYAEILLPDVIFGMIAVIVILEATRRILGWVLPVVVGVFLIYGICNLGFNWTRFTQQLCFDEGIMGIPLMVMVTYVFAFVFFGAFLLKIGVSDYMTEFMISVFGPHSGGPAKSAVVSSALMGTVSGSSVANVLTTGTFTIPLMKKAGYSPEMAGAVEPVASTGGQLMPPVMGAAAFIMAEFLGIPYRMIIIAAIIPAIIYYAGVYIFIDLETKRLGLGGIPRVKALKYFLRKLYLLLPVVVIIVALLWGIPPHICAIASLGVAVWAAWISKEKIEGNELIYVAALIITTLLMFAGKDLNRVATLALLALASGLVGLSFTSKLIKRNEKLYVSLVFILFIALTKYLGVMKEQTLLMTGILGIVFSLIVGATSKSKEGRKMYSATYGSIIAAGKTSVSIMLAAASAGLIQAVLTMTGLITKIGYELVSITGGALFLLLPLAMLFSLILGMGVPTTANYIITSLVAAPAVYLAVSASPIYASPVPGFATPIALLAAHFFVFYFGILADVTPPVALASYAGCALAGGNFWKTAMNATKYALAGYIGPYIYFLHPEMFLITVGGWDALIALKISFFLLGTILAIYLLGIAITGFFGKFLRKEIRVVAGIICFAIVVTLHYIPVILGILAILAVKFYGEKFHKIFFQENQR
ncbi:MAG: TRAP transporter fused permease subunit [Dehalococcoidia bacterium]|nr:TRAP transporter fused permease subunit [Dehalococcoidia bacterium]